MKLAELKKELTAKEKTELVALLCKLYRRCNQAQNLIDIELE